MSGGPQSGGIDRGEFIARVSAALGRKVVVAPSAAAPPVDEAIARVTAEGGDLSLVFAANATKTGMFVHRVRAAQLNDHLLGLLAGLGAPRVAVADIPALAGIRESLRGSGLELVACPGESGLAPLYQTDAGITDVQGAIAETGSLVCWSGPGRGRGMSLVPPIHIAIVRRSDIVPDLIDYLAWQAEQGPGRLPSSIVLITGPSKTADIEGVLITGVHGPRAVHILLVEDA